MTEPIYDQIGINYAKYRKADPRIAEAILDCLDIPEKGIIGDIGAGTGNYSEVFAEKKYIVKCVEPSDVMMRQKKNHQKIEWIKGDAENIPLETGSLDGVMAILSFHHFKNPEKAIEEMSRVSKGNIVLFTFDPREVEALWLASYFPEVWQGAFDFFPPLSDVKKQIEFVCGRTVTSNVYELPHNLSDFFAAAGWRKPEIYLDPIIRSCMSAFAVADQSKIDENIQKLKQDLETGQWEKNFGYLRQQESLDVGYRIIVAK